MALIRRDNGFYYIRMHNNGRVFWRTCKTQNRYVAQDIYDSFLRNEYSKTINLDPLLKGSSKKAGKKSLPQTIKSHITLSEVWNQYYSFKALENLSRSQMNTKKKVFNDLVEAGFKNMDDFNQSKINALMADYQKSYQSDSISKYINEIKCLMNYCIKNGYFTRLEYERLSFPKQVTKVKSTLISDQDLSTIFQWTYENDRDFYVYLSSLYYLACRPGEITGLKKESFDLEKKSCKVWMNKTKKFKHVIITNNEYFEFMKAHTSLHHDKDPICELSSMEHYSKKFKRLKHKLGLNPDYNLYTVRHTAGTNLYKATKDLKYTANQLGDEEKTVSRHYINLTLDYYKCYENSL